MTAPVREGDILAGKYRVDSVLGVGGMGVVVAATHLVLEEKVALKFMLPEGYGDAEMLARFTREARAAVKLKSEHVARVLDTGMLESGAPYIVMEFLQGRDLSQVLHARGGLPVSEVAEWIIHACDALAEAHALGIVHRDLKPANLFLTTRADASPLVKVLDFGISKTTAATEGLAITKTQAMLGSPLYMSPEQMRSTKKVDARSDVWSLGVIMYELLAGRPPFDATTLGELIAKVLDEPPPPLTGLPSEIVELVGRCLQRSTELRVQSVAEIASVLGPFAASRTWPIVERIATLLRLDRAPPPIPLAPAPPVTSPVRASIRVTTRGGVSAAALPAPMSPKLAALSGAAALLLVAGGTVALLGRGRSGQAVARAAPSTAAEGLIVDERPDDAAAAAAPNIAAPAPQPQPQPSPSSASPPRNEPSPRPPSLRPTAKPAPMVSAAPTATTTTKPSIDPMANPN